MRDVVQEKHGIEEGEVCGRNGCPGVLEFLRPQLTRIAQLVHGDRR